MGTYSSTNDDCFHVSGDSLSSNTGSPSSFRDPKMTSLTELINGKSDFSVAYSSWRSDVNISKI